MSITIDRLHLRPAQLLLGWAYNPRFAEEYNHISRTDLVEMVGLIPDFFAHAVTEEDLDIANIADAMDDAYGMGGFRYAFGGSISADGVYSSEGDPDLAPVGFAGRKRHRRNVLRLQLRHCWPARWPRQCPHRQVRLTNKGLRPLFLCPIGLELRSWTSSCAHKYI